ncbi:MAG TPA: hypothetical protein P5234_06760 [Thermoanaerobaculaceae bacterium]|nr:hypothetical protein [Thermoanaerobaculaceae bacterium]HRS15936.1 hypothetical protein [Thermoanaerobaculaceae bacterium]
MSSTAPTWGIEEIHIDLPACSVRIEGLSRGQKNQVACDYSRLVGEPHDEPVTAEVVCQATRLAVPLGRPISSFSRNGQYTPLKRRHDSGIEITGYEFVATVSRTGSTPMEAVLSVADEMELASPDVLQNFLRIVTAHCALDRGGVVLHSAGVVHDGRAVILAGHSNVGKTTLARKAIGAGSKVLSDDINLVLPDNGEYRAFKVPFTGELGRLPDRDGGKRSYPLAGLALLEQAPRLTAAPVRPAAAVAGLLAASPFVNDDPEELPALLDILTRLVAGVPVVRLGVARDNSYFAVIDTMLRSCEHG